MINFDQLEKNQLKYREDYLLARPFSYLVIDGFCDEAKIRSLKDELPDIQSKSRDYVFAKNKFELSSFSELSENYRELSEDLLSNRFRKFLKFICNEDVFVDPDFHGGGIHQGKQGSFLDMHLDFNYHPNNTNWFRNLNMLLYLNDDWKPEYGGQLKLEDLRTGEKKDVGVPFNRMVIQQTRSYTLHGYDPINFPEGSYRCSIASYAYSLHKMQVEKPRTTDWFVKDNASMFKKTFARYSKELVKAKNVLIGSGTGTH